MKKIGKTKFEKIQDVASLQTLKMEASNPLRNAKEYMWHSKSAMLCLSVLGIFVVLAILVPMLSPFDYQTQNVAFANKPMFSEDPLNGAIHFFGTDYFGRDIFVRVFQGARISFIVALSVALIDCIIGVLYGGIAALIGGKLDTIMMRFVDVVSGIPYLIVVLLLMSILPRGLGTIIIAYSLTGWTGMARIVRGQVMSLKQQEYIQLAKAMGASTPYLIRHHMIPNMMSIIVVSITLDIPNVIFTEAFLSLLGLGIIPPMPSWGILLNQGIISFQTYPMQLFIPAFFIIVTTLCFNVIGDRFSEAYNAKLRGR